MRKQPKKHDIRISFANKKDKGAKPSVSAAKVRKLLTEIQALGADNGVAEAQACTTESCGGVVKGVKGIAAELGVTLTCRYTCIWFYSQLGGWQKECYFKCNDGKGLTIEGTGA